MDTINVKDHEFVVSIPHSEILKEVERIAKQINADLHDKNPLFLCVLNGSFMFASDLMKKVNIPSTISFIKLASYEGTKSTGSVKTLIGLDGDLTGRHIIIIEDIVDTGNTIENLVAQLKGMNVASLRIATLLFKPKAYTKNTKIDYKAFEVPNDFLIGYGLDYDGYGRNLEHIYTIKKD
jgi:hypoxanthine phosphoribosyltransferase